MAPVGRPSSYTEEISKEICERLADGESLRRICLDDHMPSRITVYAWLLDERYSDFLTKYTRAREFQAESHADDMTDIADDGSNDWMENVDDQGAIIGYKLNGENIQRSKLRIDTRKWIASKLKPKKYGEKLELEHSGSIENVSKEQRDAAVAAAIKADS